MNHIYTCYERNFNFYLACLAEETGLKFAMLETQKTDFLALWPVLLA